MPPHPQPDRAGERGEVVREQGSGEGQFRTHRLEQLAQHREGRLPTAGLVGADRALREAGASRYLGLVQACPAAGVLEQVGRASIDTRFFHTYDSNWIGR
jgi:hypothetical protein